MRSIFVQAPSFSSEVLITNYELLITNYFDQLLLAHRCMVLSLDKGIKVYAIEGFSNRRCFGRGFGLHCQ